MSKQASSASGNRAGLLVETIRGLRLSWRLLRDPRVPGWTKLIPFLTVLYIIFPLDLVADPLLGLGQLDDIAILLLAIELFVSLAPREVVEQLRREMGFGRAGVQPGEGPGERRGDGQAMDALDAAYRVIDDDRDGDWRPDQSTRP